MIAQVRGRLVRKERERLLGEIIEELPSAERTVLSLYYYEELTMREIGGVLEVSESRVSQLHTAAMLRIRSRLRRRHVTQDDLRVEADEDVLVGGVGGATR